MSQPKALGDFLGCYLKKHKVPNSCGFDILNYSDNMQGAALSQFFRFNFIKLLIIISN